MIIISEVDRYTSVAMAVTVEVEAVELVAVGVVVLLVPIGLFRVRLRSLTSR